MPKINELYKNVVEIKPELNQTIKSVFTANEEEREQILKNINAILGDGNEFKILNETLEKFKSLESEAEKKDFIENRVENFLSRFGEVDVDEEKFLESLSGLVNNERKQTKENANHNTPSQNSPKEEKGSKWSNRFEREMNALKINDPTVHKIINSLPEGKREEMLNNLVKNGQIPQEDIVLHEKVNEKPIARDNKENPENTNPENFNNPKKSHLLNAARAIERRREDKRYQAELSAQKARRDIREANIRRIEGGTSDCLMRYSDARIVQKHNIEDFDKECHRKIGGFNEMSKSDQIIALKQRLATDPELKAAHDRVVRGYKQLHNYDDTMVRHLESARNSGIDVTRNAEEYYNVRQKNIDPARVETDEIKRARTMLDRMAERVRDAVMNLMKRFGFSKNNEKEISTPSSTVSVSGPSNG